MLPGSRAAAPLINSAVDPVGWRIANLVAIAAPYLLAAGLFAVLYLQPTAPPARTAFAASPRSASDDGSPGAAVVAPTTASPVAVRSAAPGAAKSAAPASPAVTPATDAAAPVSAPAPVKEEPLPTGPVSVEPDVAETMKLPGDTLAYPAAARAAHIQGVVVLSAMIGVDGGVQSVQPVSGPALLEAGALEAVRSWRYRPWLDHGRPVPFTTQIVVNFEIGGTAQ